MTPTELESLLAEWQAVLRLRDWDVKVKVTRARDLDDGVQGQCRWTLKVKSALILILDPIDYPPDCSWPQDQERTLVHELLHLHFAPFDDTTGDAPDIAREQAVECLATALLKLKREVSCG